MQVRLILMLAGGDAEFGPDAKAAKSGLAAYLRAAAVRVENLNDDNVVASVLDDLSGAVVGSIKLEITGGVSVDHLTLQDGAQVMASRHPSTNIGE